MEKWAKNNNTIAIGAFIPLGMNCSVEMTMPQDNRQAVRFATCKRENNIMSALVLRNYLYQILKFKIL
jgi:hypothetical protein